MGSTTTLGSLARREATLISVLAAAAALAALAGPLHAGILYVIGAVVAAVGAAGRLLIQVRRASLEGKRERRDFDRRTRVPVTSITQVDPTEIGVAMAVQDILGGQGIPDYVSRDADARLRRAVTQGLDGHGHWLVVATGRSKVGKSRAMFEAVRSCASENPIDLIAPVDSAALTSLTTPGERPTLRAARHVLWLDDLEPFLSQGLTFRALQEWHSGLARSVVVATYGGKGHDQVVGASASELVTAASELLEHAAQVPMQPTTPDELTPLRERVSAVVLESLERHGLAAYLVAAPQLERKLVTEVHAIGDQRCPEGTAVAYAAIDWSRCGRTDGMPEEDLRRLWETYLPTSLDPTNESFAAGVEWALRPVAGPIALVQREGGYRAYDYIVRFVTEQGAMPPPRSEAWERALANADEPQTFAIGVRAFRSDRLDIAAAVFEDLAQSPNSSRRAVSAYNLALVRSDLGRPTDEVLRAYADVAEQFADLPELDAQHAVARALSNRGILLGNMGRAGEALKAFEELIELFRESADRGLREQVARAMCDRGVALGMSGQSEGALAAYEELVKRFGEVPDPQVQEQVAKALLHRGIRLQAMGRQVEALAAYDEVIMRFHDAEEPALVEQARKALVNRGVLVAEMDHT